MSRATLFSIMQSSDFSAQHPFNHDYSSINYLKYIGYPNNDPDKVFGPDLRRTLNTFSIQRLIYEILTANTESQTHLNAFNTQFPEAKRAFEKSKWQQKKFREFLEANAGFEEAVINDPIIMADNYFKDQFIAFLIEDSRSYLPNTYQDATEVTNIFAHSKTIAPLQGHLDERKNGRGVFSIKAPTKTYDSDDAEDINASTLSNFSAALRDLHTTHILRLGANEPTGSRLPYDHHIRQNNPDISITEINVQDNTSINLDNDALRTILAIYEKYRAGQTICVHCDSGVGRTGQIRLLFALMDKYQDDAQFKNILNELQQLIKTFPRSDKDEKRFLDLTQAVYQSMSETLHSLRKIRYCVQTEEQFLHTLPQLLLLICTKQLIPELRKHEALPELREQEIREIIAREERIAGVQTAMSRSENYLVATQPTELLTAEQMQQREADIKKVKAALALDTLRLQLGYSTEMSCHRATTSTAEFTANQTANLLWTGFFSPAMQVEQRSSAQSNSGLRNRR